MLTSPQGARERAETIGFPEKGACQVAALPSSIGRKKTFSFNRVLALG
jgi:hypothetical protein